MINYKKCTTVILITILLISFAACRQQQTNIETGVNTNSSVIFDEDDFNANVAEVLMSEDIDIEKEGNNGEDAESQLEHSIDKAEELEKECNDSENVDIEKENDSIGNKEHEDAYTREAITYPSEVIVKITREEAGLSTLPYLDFSGLKLNPSILQLLENSTSYTNDAYSNGLIYDNIFIIVSQRFDEYIIEHIKIGDEISKILQILGEPSYITGEMIFYKTSNYYVGFKGAEEVEQAVFSMIPRSYPNDILQSLVTNINKSEFDSIPELLSENSVVSEFFDHDGHIHGGGWYAYSMNGIFVEQFDVNSITVYNNFEGELCKLKSDIYQYDIVYIDTDYIIDSMLSSLSSYNRTNEAFSEEGIVSPNGKYSSLYIWNYSQSYYFIIRAMDNSHPDVYIGLPATGAHYWLDDKFILYQHFFSQAPFLLNVETSETINILEETKIFEVDDYGFYSFEIKSYKDGEIVVFNEDEQKEYIINYSFRRDGEIILN